MESEFIEMARAATVGSSRVRSLSSQEAPTRYRATDTRLDQRTPHVRLQLIEDDGYLQWEDISTAPPDLSKFRSASGAGQLADQDALEMEFERLPPSQVTQFLAGRDDVLTPQRGIRRLDLENGTLHPASLPATGRALLLVHGTFSNGDRIAESILNSKTGRDFLVSAGRRYRGNLFTFDHPTLAAGPILNAIDLQRAVAGSDATIDLVCHSRGGLVARWWCETFDPRATRCRKVIFVGSPLAGTGLAAPPNIRQTIHLLTQFSRALQWSAGLTAMAVPVFSVVEAMLRVVTSITSLAARTPVADAAMAMVPGLFAMSRVGNHPELRRLRLSPTPVLERYFSVQANFEPDDPKWKFWRLFRSQQLVDHAADLLFDGANDLVVDTASMNSLSDELKIPPQQTLDFGTSSTVHHLNYFQQPETVDFLAKVLLDD